MEDNASDRRPDFNQKLINSLFDGNSPYVNFPADGYEEKVEGWHSDNALFEELIEEIEPSSILEVGTWLGASAIRMADICAEKRLATSLLCVDTWLGGAEFWEGKDDPSRYQQLNLNSGYPSVYYQFLANVVHRGHTNRILPLPQTSQIAGRILANLGLSFSLIYIDASHEEEDVYADIASYWGLLAKGGAIFGDDYDHFWPGVVTAVQRFASETNVKVERTGNFWCIRKGRKAHIEKSSIQVQDEVTALRIENAVLRARLEAHNARNDQISSLLAENSKLVERANSETARAGYAYHELIQCQEALKQLEKKSAEEASGGDE